MGRKLRKIKTFLLTKQIIIFLFAFSQTISSQTGNPKPHSKSNGDTVLFVFSQLDSVFYDTLNPKLKLVYKLVTDDSKDSYYFTSYYNSAQRRQTRSMYLDGTKRSRGSCNMFRTLKTKIWDKEGRVIGKSKQRPFGSTSYTHVSLKKTYDAGGHLIKFERIKYHVSCFEHRGIYKYKIIEYDNKGKRISKKKMGRLATWRQWKKTGHAVRLKDD